MVVDAYGRGHKAGGRPDGGQYEVKRGVGSDDDLNVVVASRPHAVSDRARARIGGQLEAARMATGLTPPDCTGLGPRQVDRVLAAWLDGVKPGWRWDRRMLAASMPGDGFDYRDRDPVEPMVAEMIERVELGSADRPGRMVRKLRNVIPSDVDAMELARKFVHERAESLRRNYALDPTRCLSEEAYRAGICAPFHPERVFVSVLGLSAHRMRFGSRYLKAVDRWRDAHGGVLDDETRDRIWDESLREYVDAKRMAGSGLGNGLNFSDGRSVHEGRRLRMRVKDGVRLPFNGREDFESMYEEGRRRLREWAANYDDVGAGVDGDGRSVVDLADARNVMGGELYAAGETERRTYMLALERGMSGDELDRVALACGLDGDARVGLEARWRAERVLSVLGGRMMGV